MSVHSIFDHNHCKAVLSSKIMVRFWDFLTVCYRNCHVCERNHVIHVFSIDCLFYFVMWYWVYAFLVVEPYTCSYIAVLSWLFWYQGFLYSDIIVTKCCVCHNISASSRCSFTNLNQVNFGCSWATLFHMWATKIQIL